MNLLHISPRLRPGSVNALAADLACGLQQAGFRDIKVYGELKMSAPRPGEQRIFFVARKDNT